MESTNDQARLADLMMQNIVAFGKYSFELEEKREQSLINQSSQMVTAFSVFTVAIYALLPCLITLNWLSVPKLFFCVGLVSILLLTSLVLAVLAQWRYKYSTMQNIEEFYKKVNEEHQSYVTQAQFDMQWMDQVKAIHISKRANNDKRASLVKWSMCLFFVSILALLLSAISLVFISL